ncbi:hypothetical protein CRM22_009371 [Opisthorchis felineus]|uniref:COP9 signalosome complex subunit 4 n=2 Tax=Opisthorchis felineus TaxID=147828 RepID=A0A4S2LEY3_OPIFE|nr:hypothetical protein CRM22_009371 [Opisthorchis felineus]
MSRDITATLGEVISCKIPKEANDKFVNLLQIISQCTGDEFLQHINHIVVEISQESVTVISTKKFCDELINCVRDVTDDHLAIAAFQTILNRMQSRNIAFESQIVELRNQLSRRLEATGCLGDAASVLAEIPLESGQRTYAVTFKMDIYLRIAEYYLKLQQISDAETYVNRASLLQPECEDQNLLLRYKTAYAHLLDHKHRFLEAGQRYAELSIRFPWMDEAERVSFLERALAAALLASAGHQRTRLLATLYKDERCQAFEAYPILEKMYMGRLIKRCSLRSLGPLFEKFYPHLLHPPPATGATVSAGSKPPNTSSHSVQELLERAVVEHNMLAASLIYNNISLANLGDLLEITATEAEAVASRMISEDRLMGQIDQIDGAIHFKVPTSGEDPVLASWSGQINSLCTSVNRIVEGIEAAHPDWVHDQLSARMAVDPIL